MSEEKNLIDDAFYVEKTDWGTWKSHDKDGKSLITSLTQESCIAATRWYLKQKFEEIIDKNVKKYNGSVDYKL